MMNTLFVVELMALTNFVIAIKKNRTLAEHIIPAVIVILTNYLTWQM